MAIRKPANMKSAKDEAAEKHLAEHTHPAQHENVSPLNDQAPPVGSNVLPEGGPENANEGTSTGEGDVSGVANKKTNKNQRSYPLAPHEELSEKKKKVTIEVSEDIANVFENNRDDIEKTGSALLEAHARRQGWL